MVFTGKDLDKAAVCWLEDRFVRLARSVGRTNVTTKSTSNTHLKESKIASMQEFCDNVQVLLPVLNFHILEPTSVSAEASHLGKSAPTQQAGRQVSELQEVHAGEGIHVFCKSKRGADAEGIVSSDYPKSKSLTVLEGSRTATTETECFSQKTKSYSLWSDLIERGIIENGVFTRSYTFNSPSSAAEIVLLTSANGRKEWKTEEGVALKDLSD